MKKTGFFPLTNKITTYLFETSKVWNKKGGRFKKEKGIWKSFKDNLIKDETITNKDGKKQYISSQVTSLSNDIISQSDDITYSDRFQTVANSSKDANIENSQISIDAENIVDKPNKKFWNNNELVKYFRDVKKSAIKVFSIDGIKNKLSFESQEKGDFSPKDFMMMQVLSFIQNEKTEKTSRVPKSYLDTGKATGEYAMFLEQFGDKAQGAYISVPKWTLKEARKQIKEIRDEKNIKSEYKSDQFPSTEELNEWTGEFEKMDKRCYK